MSSPKGSPSLRKAKRTFIWLIVVLVVLFLLNIAQVIWSGGNFVPKLALDLEGGTQIVLSAKTIEGQEISSEQLAQAVSIIRNRVDSAGISEAEVSSQGSNSVVVSIPGTPSDEMYNRIRSSSRMDMRSVLLTAPYNRPAVVSTETASAQSTNETEEALPPDANPTPLPSDGSDERWITDYWRKKFDSYQCRSDTTLNQVENPADPLIACDPLGTTKYLLGPVEVSGNSISNAVGEALSTAHGNSTGQWGVNITFTSDGSTKFQAVTRRLISLPSPRNQFAAVLDGQVITAPVVRGVTDRPQITGGFTERSAVALANQLKYGSLPVNFVVQSSENISPTLGTAQLESGLWAGLIGMILVLGYSLFQYRVLGLVTIGSLILAGAFTYLVITYLSWAQGYRLSLAGVAGLIVAIGITADSFIIYFERIRDNLREGRDLIVSVERGWKKALRTIFASDTVNFLAAIVLFLVAVGNVKGFAFTLGLTTIIDLVVVFLFTHPVMQTLAHNRFFASGHRLSGLASGAGAFYRGRLGFAVPGSLPKKTHREAQRRQTIAERKAKERREHSREGDSS